MMENSPAPALILETSRLELATWGPEGVGELVELHSNEEVFRYLNASGSICNLNTARDRIEKWKTEFDLYRLGKHRLTRKSDGVFIGRAGFSLFENEVPELGYILHPAYWGNGYATEIAEGLCNWIKCQATWDRFVAFAHPENLASIRVLEKIGMTAAERKSVNGMQAQFFEMSLR